MSKPSPTDEDIANANWFASSTNDTSQGTGFECARWQGYMLVRHGPGSPVLVFDNEEWLAFLTGANQGEFDL